VGGLLLLAVVAAVVLAIRLSQGPIVIDRFRADIEAALQPSDASYRVAITHTEIAWEGWRDGLRVRATGLRLERPDRTTLALVPSVSLRIGVGALIRGEVALKEVKLNRPRLRLVRKADGRVEFGLIQGQRSGGSMLPSLLRALASDGREAAGGALGELETVSIVDGDLVVDDASLGREWQATKVNGALTRDGRGIAASLEFELAADGRTVHFWLEGQHRRADGTVRVALKFKDLAPNLFASARGATRALAWFDTPFGGTIELDARDSGRIESARFDLRGTRGSLRIPGYYDTPLEIADFALSGSLSENGRRLKIANFDIRTAGPKLSTSGEFNGDEENWEYRGNFALSPFPAADIGKYWPAGLKPRARDWVTTNITAGRVEQLDLRISMRKRADRTEPLLLDQVRGDFRYSGLSVRFMDQLPPVEKIDGAATFDGRDLKFAVERGELEGVRLTGGKVEILGFEKPNEDFVVVAPIEGRLTDILRVLDRKPLGFAGALGFNPVAITADAKATITVRFLMGRVIRMRDVDVRADAELSRFTWRKGLFGLDLADGRFKLAVDKRGMALAGDARLGDEPATLKWSEAFGKTAGPRRTLELRTRFKVDAMAAAGFDMRAHMSGAFGAELKITGTDDGRTQIDGVYDLTDAAYTTPGLPVVKPRGMAASGRSLVVLHNQRVLAVPRFTIESAAVQSAGSATFHPDGLTLRTMELTRFVAGRTDLTAKIEGGRDGSKTVRLEGRALDIASLLKSGGDDARPVLPRARATARLGRVYLSRDRYVSDFVGEAVYDGASWRSIAIDAKVGRGTPVTLRLVESGQGRVLQITTPDAGAALKALGIADTVVGGQLTIRAAIDDRIADAAFAGRADMRNYRIIRAPAMARLIAMASFEGIANLLATDRGVEFGTLTMPFRFRRGLIDVQDGRLEGSQIGITVSGRVDVHRDLANLRGTIVPLYLINSMVGKLPVVGDVIVGERGSGLFAARFTVEGDLARPDFSVNPLSILTPGPFRRLFDRPASDRVELGEPPPAPGTREPPPASQSAPPGRFVPHPYQHMGEPR
jgi:hypothetical protein